MSMFDFFLQFYSIHLCVFLCGIFLLCLNNFFLSFHRVYSHVKIFLFLLLFTVNVIIETDRNSWIKTFQVNIGDRVPRIVWHLAVQNEWTPLAMLAIAVRNRVEMCQNAVWSMHNRYQRDTNANLLYTEIA